MFWAAERSPVPLMELGKMNTVYSSTCVTPRDPTIIWGTHVDAEIFDEFLAFRSRESKLVISPAHLLLRAVAQTFREHPEFNRRIIGRRVHAFGSVNLSMPILQTRHGEVDVVFLRGADTMSLEEIARRLWSEAREKAMLAVTRERSESRRSPFVRQCFAGLRRARLKWIHTMVATGFYFTRKFRIPCFYHNLPYNGASALINYLSYPGAPPITMFKPSCLPMNSCHINVTMGPPEQRPVVVDGQVVIRKLAPLFVRADHRMVDTRQIAAFVTTLCGYLSQPNRLIVGDPADSPSVSRSAA